MDIDYRELSNLEGLDLIVEERVRQVRELGYDVAHDNECHTPAELMRIGACYIDYAAADMEGVSVDDHPPFWPESSTIQWKAEGSAVENAAKGAAFTAAALDLLMAQMRGSVDG